MNELYREQYPLLCDDFSDDDLSTQNCSPRSNKRLRSIVYGGHTKNQMKGAAHILQTWPEHWWSTLKYWWMGIGMLAIVVLIVYNSVVAFSILPMVYTKTFKSEDSYISNENILSDQSSISDVYMHVFAETKNKVNLNDYLPYVEIISKRYPSYKFNFIIVLNETFKESEEMDDETKNIIALNSLWTDVPYGNYHRVVDNNLAVSYVSINNYLTNPVLQKISTNFSKEFIEFLVRVLSIWEKGGVVFNPIILTPSSPNGSYIEKIYYLLNSYVELRDKQAKRIKENTRQSKELHKSNKRLDNIRDIINALEEDEKLYNVTQHNLIEAEDKVYSVAVNADNKIKLLKEENTSNLKSTHQNSHFHSISMSNVNLNKKNNTNHHLIKDQNRNSTYPSLLPLFLEYLSPKSGKFDTSHKKEMTVSPYDIHYERDNYPLTDSKHKRQDSNYNVEKGILDIEENSQLTIDLKGNIVASNTPCHAFVGNLLRNAAHHNEEESLTEFIIAELTVFCNGVLSSCKGINVILL